ncbi:phospholipase C [Lactococcus garvieae]|uniref:phospholipase C n=1 Tax=Lactococcus garvieae TaxID=1363 RepID=UPI0038523931
MFLTTFSASTVQIALAKSTKIEQPIYSKVERPSCKWSAEDVTDETVNTHLWIVNNAIKILTNASTTSPVNINKLNETFTKDNREKLEQGIYDADHLNPFMDSYSFASHFYDPFSDNTYIPGYWSNAKTSGTKYFNESVEYYKKGDISKSIYYLGLSLHYFTDVSQPMHAHNYTNLSWPVGFHSKYENFVDTIKDQADAHNEPMIRLTESTNPAEWLTQNAWIGYKNFDKIVNNDTTFKFLQASTSQKASDEWHDEMTIPTIKILIKSQQTTAGYINLWLNAIGTT